MIDNLFNNIVFRKKIKNDFLEREKEAAKLSVLGEYFMYATGINRDRRNYYFAAPMIYTRTLYEELVSAIGQIENRNIPKENIDWLIPGMAYIQNLNFYTAGIHNHLIDHSLKNYKVYVGVYYLSVPESLYPLDDNLNGALNFYSEPREQSKIFSYKPEEHDLIIFPNSLYHKPSINYSEEYRISINMKYQTIIQESQIF